MFKIGDVVQAKKEWLDKGESQESTRGIVVDVCERNLMIVEAFAPNMILKPQMKTSMEYYERVD